MLYTRSPGICNEADPQYFTAEIAEDAEDYGFLDCPWVRHTARAWSFDDYMGLIADNCGLLASMQTIFPLCVLGALCGDSRLNAFPGPMYLKSHEDGITLSVRVTPNSSKNAVISEHGDRLAVKLTAPAVEGKANKSLLKLIGKKLGVPPSSINIIRGHSSREKVLFIPGIDEESAIERLK